VEVPRPLIDWKGLQGLILLIGVIRVTQQVHPLVAPCTFAMPGGQVGTVGSRGARAQCISKYMTITHIAITVATVYAITTYSSHSSSGIVEGILDRVGADAESFVG
jgi:hypothetical protein